MFLKFAIILTRLGHIIRLRNDIYFPEIIRDRKVIFFFIFQVGNLNWKSIGQYLPCNIIKDDT